MVSFIKNAMLYYELVPQHFLKRNQENQDKPQSG